MASMSASKTLCIYSIFLGSVCVSTSGCGGQDASAQEESVSATRLPVVVTTASVADLAIRYATTATIEADSEAPVLARVAGEISEVYVEEGDFVEQGQILASLDGDRLRLQARKAHADFERATREYERLQQLHARDLVSTAALDNAQFDLNTLKAAYERSQLEYSYTNVRATIAGVVSARIVKVGTHVSEGSPLFQITETSRLIAYLNIPQTELAKFSPGDPTTISVDAFPAAQFRGEIARLSPTIDAINGTFRATVYIDNQEGRIAPGMFGHFSITYETHDDALVIPESAVLLEDDRAVVYVVKQGMAVQRRVEIGIAAEGMQEITAGLAENDPVVLQGQARLSDGTPVLIASATARPNAG